MIRMFADASPPALQLILQMLLGSSPSAYIASVCSSGFGSKTNDHLCSAVAYFNPNVPPDMALQIDAILSAPSVQQNKLSSMLDTHMFNLMLENSSTADRARLLSVSSAHASSWLSVVPSQGLGLHLDPPVHQIAIKWWLGLDTSQRSQCALCPGIALDPLGHHAITCKRGGDVVTRHNTLRDVLAEICHRAHLGVQVEAGNDLNADHSHNGPADLLLTNWATCKTAAFDISVTSPLNTLTLLEAGVSAGSAAQATETRKHMANDAKCNELGWLCVPLVVETYRAWEKEGMDAFSQLASRLATHTCRLKSAVTFELYSRLNLHLLQYLDDGILVGERSAVVRALHLIEELGPHLGLFFNYPKCEVFSRNGISLFPASVKSSILPNLEILGAPIGDIVHCSRFFAEKHNNFKVLLGVILDVAAVDLHVAISLLRMCGGYCKLVHLARTTPTNLCEDSLKFFDEEVRLCFSSCVAIDVPDTQWQQAQLSPKLGGLGLRSLSLHSCAAFISSVASLEMGNPDNTHLQQAILHFNARVSPQDSITMESVLNSPPQQKSLSQKLDSFAFHSLLSSASLVNKARMLSVSSPHASSWITAIPSTSLKLHLDSAEYQTAIRKACQVLTSSGVAPNNDDSWNLLISKHPSSACPAIPLPSNRDFTFPPDLSLMDILRSFPKLTAAGPSGLRIQHLIDAAEVPLQTPLLHTLHAVINLLISGSAPLDVAIFLAEGNLTVLNKPVPGDIRPIAVGEALRHLTGKCLCAALRSKMASFFEPYQFGVAFPCGAEKIAHGLRTCIEQHWSENDFGVLKVDMTNAFNLVSRQAILSECAKHFPELLPWEEGPALGIIVNLPKCEAFSRHGLDMFPLRMKKSDKPSLEILGIPIDDQEFCSSFISKKHTKAKILLSLLEEMQSVLSLSQFISLPEIPFWWPSNGGLDLTPQRAPNVHCAQNHSKTRPADILLPNWFLGRTAALDVSIPSPLNPVTLLEAGVSATAAAQATEARKLQANDPKCSELDVNLFREFCSNYISNKCASAKLLLHKLEEVGAQDAQVALVLLRLCGSFLESFAQRPPIQKALSAKIDDFQFNQLFNSSSLADRARLLSISSPHASSWLSVVPSEGLGLHLNPDQFQEAIKWWLGLDTSGGSLCSLCPDTVLDPLGHHASTSESCRLAHLSVKVEAGNNLTPDHSHTRPAA
eukprot:Em0002g871a